MFRTFNMGTGLIMIAKESEVSYIIKETGGFVIGEIKDGNGVEIV